MKVVLMGTGPFAVPAFEAIRQSEHQIAAVITKPIRNDKNATIHPVAEWATDHQLRIEMPVDMRADESLSLLKSFSADLAVVCDYGQILNKQALESTRLGAINLHGSLLPKHRGAAPIQWSLLLGDKVSGVTVICMTTGLDSGPILTMCETEISCDENAVELEARLSKLGIKATLDAIKMLSHCSTRDDVKAIGTTQDSTQATKAPRINKSDGQIDFRWSVNLIDRVVRAMQPWPSAFAEVKLANDKLLRVQLQKIVPIPVASSLPSNLEPGMLGSFASLEPHCGQSFNGQTSPEPNDLLAVASDGFVKIEMIQPAGKRAMKATDFTAGYARNAVLRFVIPDSISLII